MSAQNRLAEVETRYQSAREDPESRSAVERLEAEVDRYATLKIATC